MRFQPPCPAFGGVAPLNMKSRFGRLRGLFSRFRNPLSNKFKPNNLPDALSNKFVVGIPGVNHLIIKILFQLSKAAFDILIRHQPDKFVKLNKDH